MSKLLFLSLLAVAGLVQTGCAKYTPYQEAMLETERWSYFVANDPTITTLREASGEVESTRVLCLQVKDTHEQGVCNAAVDHLSGVVKQYSR
jgi:hypothetical protein